MLKSAASIFVIMLIHAYFAPYTKVEESFNMQAIYDLIYNTDLAHYDHKGFPGVVPRTFIGPLIFSYMSKPFAALVCDRAVVQHFVRLLLAASTSLSLGFIAKNVEEIYGSACRNWFVVITICQFHLMFWGSRFLPNILALVLYNVCVGIWISKSWKRSRWLMTVLLVLSIAVFRAEQTILAVTMVLIDIFNGNYTLAKVIITTACAMIIIIPVTIFIDSYFWGYWVWPELQVFMFNGIEQRSSEWGTSPFYAYFAWFLPKIAPIGTLGSIYTSIANTRTVKRLFLPSLLHLVALSFISHKEWRFVIYAVPILNIGAAIGLTKLQHDDKQKKRWHDRLALLAAQILIAVSFCSSIVMLYISTLNYPGGYALAELNRHCHNSCKVHIDSYCAMTGITKFGQIPTNEYFKTESHQTPSDWTDAGYQWLITHSPEFHKANYKVVASVLGYSGVSISPAGFHIKQAPVCFVMTALTTT